MRQLAAAAGDGWLGSVGSPGQLETSLNSGYTVGPCNSYLEGPTPILWACCSRPSLACCSRIARSYPPPSSLFANGKAFAHRSSDRRARDFRRSQLRGSRCPTRRQSFGLAARESRTRIRRRRHSSRTEKRVRSSLLRSSGARSPTLAASRFSVSDRRAIPWACCSRIARWHPPPPSLFANGKACSLITPPIVGRVIPTLAASGARSDPTRNLLELNARRAIRRSQQQARTSRPRMRRSAPTVAA